MDFLQALILGIIQGLGEFLPISSSGHLVLAPKFFRWSDQGLAFDVALHFGTLLALLAYFKNDWLKILRESYLLRQTYAIVVERRREFFVWKKVRRDLLFIILVATVPGVLAGTLLGDYAEVQFRNPLLVAVTLALGALLLLWADQNGKQNLRQAKKITLPKGLLVGLAQALAVIPGLSRSGMTISAGLLVGLDRSLAARFSFLLATPIILGATVKEFPKAMNAQGGGFLLLGVLVAAVSGYAAIKYLLRYVENRSYKIFVIYRILLAILVWRLFQ